MESPKTLSYSLRIASPYSTADVGAERIPLNLEFHDIAEREQWLIDHACALPNDPRFDEIMTEWAGHNAKVEAARTAVRAAQAATAEEQTS